MIRVLVVGQTPPPFHGQSIAIQKMLDGKYTAIEMHHVRMGFSRDIKSVGRFQFAKLFEMLRVIACIFYTRVRCRTTVLYYPPAGPQKLPMLRDIVVLLATRWMFTRVVFHFHASGISQMEAKLSGFLKFLFRRAYYQPDASIRSSRQTIDDGAALRAKADFIIPLGVEDFSDTVPARESNGLPRLLFVGILSREKGLLDFLAACRILVEAGHKFAVDIMGAFHDDAVRTEAMQLIEAGKLSEIVQFHGVLTGDAKHHVFAQASVLCFPTFYVNETFGLVVVEAMSFEMPVVSTRWRGIPDIVDEGQTGFLVEPHDVASVAERLARLIEDSNLRSAMGSAGRAKYLRNYTVERFTAGMEEMFLQVAGGKDGPKVHAKRSIQNAQHAQLPSITAAPQVEEATPV